MPIELPSDPLLVEAVTKEVEAVIERIRKLDSDAKLKCVRRLAKGANSTSRHFNVAVFIADKEEEAQPALLFNPPEPELIW